MILSDRAIRNCLITGQIKIEPFNKDNLGPVSYDLTVGKVFEFMSGVSYLRGKYCTLEPGTVYGIETLETIGVKGITGIISLRSRASRLGIFSSNLGLVDPGYLGKLTFTVEPKLKAIECTTGLSSLFWIMFMKNTLVDKPWEGDSKRF